MRNSTSPGITRWPSTTLRSSTIPSRGAIPGEGQAAHPGCARCPARSCAGTPKFKSRCAIRAQPWRRSGSIDRYSAGCASDRRTVKPQERLALSHLASGRDVFDGFDKRLGAQRDHRDAALIKLNCSRRPHGLGNARAAPPVPS